MIDVLYILGSGSKYDNLELRLSLRCLEANCKNFDKVFLVGEKPGWIQNVVYIKETDNREKEKNTFKKVLTACKNGISDNFLYMNDDFFIMKPMDAETYPYFCTGVVGYIENPSRYQKVQNKTLAVLQSEGINPVKSFCGHFPFRFNREKFLSLEKFYLKTLDGDVGLELRNMYGNLFVKDYKNGFDVKTFGDVMPCFENEQGCFSIRDEGISILKEIEKIYNKPSKYEKSI